MSDKTEEQDEVPTEVALAARLWVSDKKISEPEHAAWYSHFTWMVLRRIVVVGALTALGVLMVLQLRHLLGILVISTFFALAIVPGVNSLHRKYGMRRGAAVGIVYLMAAVTVILLVAVLIPAIVEFADQVQESMSGWIADLNAWTTDTFGGAVITSPGVQDSADEFLAHLGSWAGNAFGLVTSGIGFIFDVFTIAAFTFYIAADFPRIRAALASRMTPERQRVFGWITDQSIEQTGGYFYSRLLLMIVNGSLGFVVMVILGMPLVYAIPMALFMGFVSEFIPFIGTYIGAAIPILLMLAVQGLVPAVLFLVWVLIYQQIENYWLSPRFSSQTMELNGAVAFGGAMAGGAIAGPMGAFMALPIAALITAVVKNAGRTYAVVIEDLDGPELGDGHDADVDVREHARWQFWRK
ncbi:AI-2E family transporter [Demequina sp.]|uniref:AI-2E family transporter n=1 Tax=Demequina sp. TaxID=2050685 RepID=UPI003D13DDF5